MAFAVPSIGSTTSVSGFPKSLNACSSLSTFSGFPFASSTLKIASSAILSMREVGVPSAPIPTSTFSNAPSVERTASWAASAISKRRLLIGLTTAWRLK